MIPAIAKMHVRRAFAQKTQKVPSSTHPSGIAVWERGRLELFHLKPRCIILNPNNEHLMIAGLPGATCLSDSDKTRY